MKTKIAFAILFTLFIVFILSSCTKEKIDNQVFTESNILEYEIPVYEQESVDHYVIEISYNGKKYEGVGMILATTSMEQVYRIKIDVNNNLQKHGKLFTRVKSVDIDSTTLYSPIYVVYK